MLRKIERRPDPVLVVKYTSLTLAIVAAIAVGWLAHDDLAPAPHECTVMANTAEKAFVAYENLATSTQLAVSRGRSEYDQHEADIASAREELDALAPTYNDAEVACLGATR